MFVYTSKYLKCGIIRVSHFHNRKYRSSIRTSWKYSLRPACLNTHDLTGHWKLHYQIKAMEKGQNDVAVEDFLRDPPLSNACDTVMVEALSSLITRQKRGVPSSIGGKYGKLDRMRMYLKILDMEENISRLKVIHVAGTKGKEQVTDDLPMPPLFQFLIVPAFKIFSKHVDVAIVEVGLGGTKDSTNAIKEPIVFGITSLGMDHTELLGNTLGEIASHKAGIFKHEVPAFTVPQLSKAMDVLHEKAHD